MFPSARAGQRILRGRFAAATVMLSAGILLGGCSSVPDVVNPVAWYRGTTNWIKGEPADTAQAPAQTGQFPKLSSVPARPQPISPAERQDIMQGLVSDRANARYSDEAPRLDGTPTRPLQPAQGG
ncbi:MAG: hypothetical protein H3C38_05125 [Rhodospirillales bacterium]|nr:hypothetical protein [Rhodospirillales bacterium]